MIQVVVLLIVNLAVLFQQGLAATEYGYVVAPLIVRFNQSEDVLVGTFGNNINQQFRVWCVNSKMKEFSIQTGTVTDKGTPTMTSLVVREDDLIDETLTEKPRMIQICATVGGNALPCKDLWIDYKTGFMIVQTDKPVYTPEQKVSIRVVAVDEALKPMKDKVLTFEIISPSNQTMGRKRLPTKSAAFYTHALSLPPYPELGIWTASVGFTGQYESVGRALFKVMEYVRPTFEVSVSVNKDVILANTKDVKVTVTAIYVYGKPVAGTASIMFNITDKMGDSKMLSTALKKELTNGAASFKINTTELFDDDKLFPVNKYLRVHAIVVEAVTGNEEEGFNDKTLMAEQRYKFSFARSKHTFLPQYDYHLKIDILKANGMVEKRPKKVTITRINDGFTKQVESSNGQVLVIFKTPQQYSSLDLQASINTNNGNGNDGQSEVFTIHAYKGTKMIQLDIPEIESKTFIEVRSDKQKNTDSGILVLGITRGKIVTHEFIKDADAQHKNIDGLKRDLSPRARFVGLYINGVDRSLVADAIKVEFDPVCPGNGLTLVPERSQCEPGKKIKFNITGDPYMHIGLSGIDVATLSFDKDNVLKPDRLFQELRERDRGCGQGGGLTSGEVLKHAGLQILVNVNVEETDKSSPGDPECKASSRHKRSALFCADTEQVCCTSGIAEAEAIMNGTTEEEKMKMNAEAKCYAKALGEADRLPRVDSACLVAYFRSCREEIEHILADVRQISARSGLERTSQYDLDLQTIGLKHVPSRTDFQESILFDKYITLNEKGYFVEEVKHPDSITTWNFQAIGVTDVGTMCIAEPVQTQVIKDFFIQLDLPYQAKKLELFEVKATVFNYASSGDELSVNLYMAASKYLCYDGTPNRDSHQTTIELGPNDVKSVTFLVMPLKAAKSFKIKVTAIVADKSNVVFDSVEKELNVENEGIQVRETIQVCIDYFNQSKDCVDSKDRVTTSYPGNNEQISTIDLTLPDGAITGTGVATGYLEGSIMGSIIQTVISGTEAAFNGKPHGCGEQTMIYTAPSVFALNYLKATKQMTSNAEVKGTDNIRYGVNREISLFRHNDFSYSCCNARAGSSNQGWFHGHTRPSSVWLTAFVMKVFCHAKRVVDDVLDTKDDLYHTLMWLASHQDGSGAFKEIMTVNIQSMMGQMGSDDRTRTAFVLISLLECEVYRDKITSNVVAAQMYLENVDDQWLRQNPHGLAIITYALALCKSPKRQAMKDLLLSTKVYSANIGSIHWESYSTGANGPNIETTSYALLAMLQYDDLETAATIVRWLTLYQKSGGGFYSTQSTAISLQALSQYAIRTSFPETSIKVSLLGSGFKAKEYEITNANRNLQTIVHKLPVEKGNNKLTLQANIKGGSGKMKIDLVYYRPATQTEMCAFNISDIQIMKTIDGKNMFAGKRKCDVCGYCALDPKKPNNQAIANNNNNNAANRRKREASDDKTKCVKFRVSSLPGDEYGMSIVRVGLQTGVSVIKDDLDKLMQDNENIFLYETTDNQEGYIVFYLLTLDSTVNEFTFRVKDGYDKAATSKTRQPAMVEVYDYYNDDISCRKIYGLNNNTGSTFDHTCDGNECKCISSICARDVRSKLAEYWKKKMNPKLRLQKYACNRDNVGYVIVVKITKLYGNDKNTREVLADAILENKYFDGGVTLDEDQGDTMVFYWPSHCTFPKLKKGQKYLIVGRERHVFKTPNNTKEMRYSLSGSTLILEKRKDQRGKQFNKLLNEFGKAMRDTGCQNFD